MIANFGFGVLVVSWVVTLYSVFAAIYGERTKNAALVESARRAMLLTWPLLTLTAGIGYTGDTYRADFAWQYDLPHTGHTGPSSILDGEYSHTSTSLRAHWFGLTFTKFF